MRPIVPALIGLAMVLTGPACRSSSPWIRIGSPGGCRIAAMIVVGSRVFASVQSDIPTALSVYSSADGGRSWRPSNRGLPKDDGVDCFATDGSSVFAGTGSHGVFVTRDGGARWRTAGSGWPELRPDPDRAVLPSVNALAVGENVFAEIDGKGIWALREGAPAWSPADAGLPPDRSVRAIVASDAGTFVSTYERGLYALNRKHGIWAVVPHLPFEGARIVSLHLHAGTLLAATDVGIFLTTDGGGSWAAARGVPMGTELSCMASAGSVLFGATDHEGLYVSTDGGLIWQHTGEDLGSWNVAALAQAGRSLIAGTESGGIFVSSDGGRSWKASNAGLPDGAGLMDVEVVGRSVFATTSSNISYFRDALEFEGGIFVTDDDGRSWRPVNRGLTSTFFAGLTALGPDLFAATWDGVFVSTDLGKTWLAAGEGLPPGLKCDHIAAEGERLYVVGERKLFSSVDRGASWTPVEAVAPDAGLLLIEADGSDLYSAWAGLGVFKLSGGRWSEMNHGLPPEPYVGCLLAEGRYLYAGLERPSEFSGEMMTRMPAGLGLYRSEDGGARWEAVDRGFPSDVFVRGLAVHEGLVFAGTMRNGILVSGDKGRSWKPLRPVLPDGAEVRVLAVRGRDLYAVGESGLWRLPLDRSLD